MATRSCRYVKTNGGNYEAIVAWKGSQAGSSWGDDAQAIKAWIAGRMNLPAKDVFWKNGVKTAEKKLKDLVSRFGQEGVDQAFTAHHAFMQEMLAHTELLHNDRARRAVRLIRTEDKCVMGMHNLKPGLCSMPRGLCESASPFHTTSVHGEEVTLQAVPHSKVLGFYGMERNPGAGNCGFLGENENEMPFVAAGVVPFKYLGNVNNVTVDFAAGEDAAAWTLPLSHLRP
jgi:hypothetical protein